MSIINDALKKAQNKLSENAAERQDEKKEVDISSLYEKHRHVKEQEKEQHDQNTQSQTTQSKTAAGRIPPAWHCLPPPSRCGHFPRLQSR